MSDSSCCSQQSLASDVEREPTEQIVCDELSHLTEMLKSHLSRLSLKEKELNERERQLGELSLLAANAQSTLSAYVQEEVSKTDQANQKTIDELRSALLAREGEMERLKHSYEQARHTNQQLRSQLEEERCGKLVLEKDMKQLQARVASLQAARSAHTTTTQNRVVSLQAARNTQTNTTHKQQAIANVVDQGSHQLVKKKKIPIAVSVEERDSLIAVLMNWLSQLLSQCTCSTHYSDSYRLCRHLLPLLTKLLPDLSPFHHLPLLKLTLWTIKLLPEKNSVMSCMRSLGRYIHCPTPIANKKPLFTNSSDIAIRTLSSLSLLSTLSEEGAHLTALQCLLQDLTQAECRELFVKYSGVSILTEVMRPANKRVTQMAVTILTMLSLHSVDQCCSEGCIESVATLLQHPAQLTQDTLNNITILLQRLSDNRYCWRWFMGYGIVSSLERLRDNAASADPHSHFRLQNIQSILNNKPLQ